MVSSREIERVNSGVICRLSGGVCALPSVFRPFAVGLTGLQVFVFIDEREKNGGTVFSTTPLLSTCLIRIQSGHPSFRLSKLSGPWVPLQWLILKSRPQRGG